MSNGVSVICEQRFSVLVFVVRGQDNVRKSPTAYNFER